MALQKEIELTNGVKVNYHRIQRVEYNLVRNQTIVHIESYVNKDIREESKRVPTLRSAVDRLNQQLILASESNNADLVKSLRIKINDLLVEYNVKVNKRYSANMTHLYIDGLPEKDLSLKGVYELVKTLDTYSKSKEV
ncbi:MAG: hypothetical protein IJF92_00095 [Bacilli bacterium]|nr:hypothetical protein [Bacilli bacterium]MBQ3307610.1 hypothetical protein [Bacilli bacterium]MBQ3422834.1 hypothetical protein [Romboutsia sp.]